MGFSVFRIWELNPVDIPSFSYILNPSPIYFFSSFDKPSVYPFLLQTYYLIFL